MATGAAGTDVREPRGRAATRAVARDALALRCWALDRLLGGVNEPPPDAGADAWRLFLRIERCAAVLQESVAQTGTVLPADAARALSGQALREMHLVLLARAQLRTIAAAAEQLGITVVALKGTADVALGHSVPCADVDVLASPDDARRLAAALDAAGFDAQSSASKWHLDPRTMAGALAVEIHTAVAGFPTPTDVPLGDAVPLADCAPLRALAPHDHAWTILCQAACKHADRWTRLRDLTMLSAALERMSTTARALLDERIAAHRAAAMMRDMITRARHPRSGWRDPLQHRMPAAYLTEARRFPLDPRSLRGRLWRQLCAASYLGPRAYWRHLAQRTGAHERHRLHPRIVLRATVFLAAFIGSVIISIDSRPAG